jgi:DNA-binding protein H-NS
MTSLQELLAQKAAIEKQIAETQRQERTDAIAKVKALMGEYGLTPSDLVTKSAAPKTTDGKKVAAKYRDPVSGQSWSGRGLKPKWLQAALANGKQLSDYAL